MKNSKSFIQNIGLLVLSTIVTFVVIEVIARIYLTNFAEEKFFERYASLNQLQEHARLKLSPHRYLGHYPTPNYQRGKNRHNSLGYRGDEIIQPKPEKEFRIVCLGGSTTYTSDVEDYRMSYPALLQQELQQAGYKDVKVINAGVPAWTSWETLINFQLRVLDLHPDMIIVYHGINDIHPRIVWPPDTYQGDNSGVGATMSQIFMPSIFEYSTVIRYFTIRLGLTRPHSSLSSVTKFRNTFYGNDFEFQIRQGRYPDGYFRKLSVSKMLMTNRPIYFKRNIENLIAIAKYHHVQVMLATFSYSSLFKEEPKVASYEYRTAFEENNELLKNIAHETGVYLFDFAALFPKDKQYYTDGRHLNEKGVILKAEMFAKYIISNDLIPLRLRADSVSGYQSH